MLWNQISFSVFSELPDRKGMRAQESGGTKNQEQTNQEPRTDKAVL